MYNMPKMNIPLARVYKGLENGRRFARLALF